MFFVWGMKSMPDPASVSFYQLLLNSRQKSVFFRPPIRSDDALVHSGGIAHAASCGFDRQVAFILGFLWTKLEGSAHQKTNKETPVKLDPWIAAIEARRWRWREGLKELHALPLTALNRTWLVAQPDDSSQTISEPPPSSPVWSRLIKPSSLFQTQVLIAITI
ncbi:hypothetical protein BDV10DRAFT_134623 [Aspergillus recurvatus]